MQVDYRDHSELTRYSPGAFLKALADQNARKITVIKSGERTVFGGVVYEIQEDGSNKKVGLSWQNTTETIIEHEGAVTP